MNSISQLSAISYFLLVTSPNVIRYREIIFTVCVYCYVPPTKTRKTSFIPFTGLAQQISNCFGKRPFICNPLSDRDFRERDCTFNNQSYHLNHKLAFQHTERKGGARPICMSSLREPQRRTCQRRRSDVRLETPSTRDAKRQQVNQLGDL